MFFPLRLEGPDFLVVYGYLSAGLLVLLWLVTFLVRFESIARSPRLTELAANPYKIAYLRGGPNELLKVAVVNLVDRGLLNVNGEEVRCAPHKEGARPRQPLDRAIINGCVRSTEPRKLLKLRGFRDAGDDYKAELQAKGFLLSNTAMALVHASFAAFYLIVGGLFVVRFVQGFVAGHKNMAGLVFLGLAALCLATYISRKRVTYAGRKAIDSLKTLISRGAKGKPPPLRPGGETNDVLLYASLFGVHALPMYSFRFVDQLFPRRKKEQFEGSADAWGSSDRASGDSCGSGGCGGGGGCGGCGG